MEQTLALEEDNVLIGSILEGRKKVRIVVNFSKYSLNFLFKKKKEKTYCLKGIDNDKVFNLKFGSNLIGRSPECNIILDPSFFASSKHAILGDYFRNTLSFDTF